MKYIKKFEHLSDKEINMDDYLWLDMFWGDLDCRVFNDKNLGGYGLGISGDYFINNNEFKRAITKKGTVLEENYTPWTKLIF